VADGHALRVGDDTTLVVADDRVQLSIDRPATGNALEARILTEEFVGATAIVHLEAAGGQELRAQKSHDEMAHLSLPPGARVWVTWSPDAGHVLSGH
jgi:spermidine/putrescine transport system ATP-binding protein